jgi:hypothetical protein
MPPLMLFPGSLIDAAAAIAAACCAPGDMLLKLKLRGAPGFSSDMLRRWGARACKMMRLRMPTTHQQQQQQQQQQ